MNDLADVILQIKGLTKSYQQRSGLLGMHVNHVQALKGIDLTLKSGQTLAIVGESGSGKSTLARCLLQLQPADSGQVLFKTQDAHEMVDLTTLTKSQMRQVRRDLQMVFQDPFASLNPRMKVGDIVGEGLLIHQIGDAVQRRNQVIEMLRRVGLTESDMQKYPHEFSGGQRQRIGIARALVLKPRVVVCDEPVSALDVSIQAQIIQLLKSMQIEMGLSYLFITHDLRVVRHVANDVLVMQHGAVVETGAVDEIYTSPKAAYTKKLLASIPGKKVF